MRRRLLLGTVVLALLPSTAQATTLVLPDGTERPQPWQQWLDDSALPTPPWHVTLHLEKCPFYDPPAAACATAFDEPKDIYTSTPERQVLHHEMGHMADAYFLDDGERNHFMRLARIDKFNGPGSTWWRSRRGGRNQPAEVFADTWAACSVTGRTRQLWGGDNSSSEWPPRKLLRWLCPFIARASRDPGQPLLPPPA